jgi:hypothetical protein
MHKWDPVYYESARFNPNDRVLSDMISTIVDKYVQPPASYASENMLAGVMEHSLRQLQDDPTASFQTLHVIDPGKIISAMVSVERLLLRDTPETVPRYFGSIVNTHEDGYHWIALLLDMEEKTIECYDSFGVDPKQEYDDVRVQMQSVFGLFQKTKPYRLAHWRNDQPWRYRTSTVTMQHSGVECGMFCLWFLHQRVRMQSMAETVQYGLDHGLDQDGRMCALKRSYFRPIAIPRDFPLEDQLAEDRSSKKQRQDKSYKSMDKSFDKSEKEEARSDKNRRMSMYEWFRWIRGHDS